MAIFDLDLEPILVKIMDRDEGLGWDLEYAKMIEIEYKKFLTLCAEFPQKAIVPPVEVDKMWHYHILDTMKYAEDCQNIFGYFLHHFPYFGMRGVEDANNLQNAWAQTCELYIARFGKPSEFVEQEIWQKVARCPNCGRQSEEFGNISRPKIAV